MLVAGDRALDLDVLGQPDLALEGAVLDLHLLVDATVRAVAAPLAGNEQRPLACDDGERLRVDAGQLDHDDELVRLVGVVAVDVRPETPAEPGEPRDLPEIGEELLDLAPGGFRG